MEKKKNTIVLSVWYYRYTYVRVVHHLQTRYFTKTLKIPTKKRYNRAKAKTMGEGARGEGIENNHLQPTP